MARFAALFAALLATAGPAAADPLNPFDLARGLAEAGMPDLALEFIDKEVAPTAPTDVKAVLPLERAKVRLAAAADEADDGLRDGMLAEARADLDRFLKANPTHARATEAAVDLARVSASLARGMLARAAKLEDKDAYKAAAAASRKPIQDAAAAFGRAAQKLDDQLKAADLPPARKTALTREYTQALLDQAITSYQVSRTFVDPTLNEKLERGKAIDTAKAQFEALYKRFPDTATGMVARAWMAQCLIALDTRKDAEKIFDEVKRNYSAGAAAGRRMVRYFDAWTKFEDALSKPSPATVSAAKAATAEWLRDYGTGRPTPEMFAVLYLDATLKQKDAVTFDEKAKQAKIKPDGGMPMLRDAERSLRRITLSENEYTDRAAQKRTEVIRLIVGDAEKDPQRIFQFDEAVMSALVQFDKAMKTTETDAEKRKAQMAKVVALLERATELPLPRDAAQELADTQTRLSYAYLMAGDPYRAAVLGDSVARSSRVSGTATRAGSYAIRAFLAAAGKVPAEDATSRNADRDRAVSLGRYLDKKFPADPNTDGARVTIGQLLLQDAKQRDAFGILSRVSPTSDRAAVARLLQGTAAFDLLRPPADGQPGIAPAERDALYKKLVADVRAVPQPPADTLADPAEVYSRLALMLAQIHLTAGPAGYAEAEKEAARAAEVIKGFTQLPAPDKAALGFLAEDARLRAIYAQVVPLFRDGKFDDVLTRLDPIIAGIAKDGPAVKDGQEEDVAAAAKKLDEFRREHLLVLALQTQIRKKSVEKAGELFDLLKKLGGSLDASVAALNQLLGVVKPQIDELEKTAPDDAKALIDGVAALLDKVAAEPNLTPKVQMFLGRGLKDIKAYDRAVAVLDQIPAPQVPASVLEKPATAEKDEDRVAVLMYRGSRLDLARAYRLKKDFGKAQETLKAAMGDDQKPGWAKTAPDFRKEALYLLEAKAAASADPKEAGKLWAEAKAGWDKIANEYRGMLMAKLQAIPPEPKPPAENAPASVRKKYEEDLAKRQEIQRANDDKIRQKESVVKPLYFDAMYESFRCLSRANAQLLKDDQAKLKTLLAKVADSIKKTEDSNPGLTEDTRAKFAALRAEFPAIEEEYARLQKVAPKPMPKPDVAADPDATPDPNAPKPNGDPAAATATPPKPDDAPKPAQPPAENAEEDGGGAMILGAVAALVSVGVGGYFVFGKKKKGPPPRKYGVKKDAADEPKSPGTAAKTAPPAAPAVKSAPPAATKSAPPAAPAAKPAAPNGSAPKPASKAPGKDQA